MPLDNRDTSIIAQVSAKIASEQASAANRHNENVDITVLLSDFAVAFKQVNEGLIDSINAQIAAAAFPGSTVVGQGDVHEAPKRAYGPAQAAPVAATAPAAIPGVSDGNPATAALWEEYFADKSKWWDNRVGKIPKSQGGEGRNVRGPDFKHKDDGDKALWIDDKGIPSWVAQRLARG